MIRLCGRCSHGSAVSRPCTGRSFVRPSGSRRFRTVSFRLNEQHRFLRYIPSEAGGASRSAEKTPNRLRKHFRNAATRELRLQKCIDSREVTDEGDRGDGSGCGNGRDEARGAARAAGGGARQPLGADYRDGGVQGPASGFPGDELSWPSTWIDRLGRDRTPSIPGHELAGVVTALSYGTTGLSVGQRVFGLTDWTRDGTLAEYVAVEARNLAPLPGDVDFTVGA